MSKKQTNHNVIYKNKGESFKCNLDIDGADYTDVDIRLCLEFNDNKNLFFKGQVSGSGECVMHIPRLPEIESRHGTLRIEAIVDGTYFDLYHCPIELKKSVSIKVDESSFFNNSKK